MRAVRARGFGGVEVLEVAEVAVPAAGPGQVRIRVEAATVNPVDLATRSGALTEAGLLPERDLVGLGWDVAGVVAEVGAGVSGFAMGDRVVGLSDRLDVTLGTHADQVVLDATAVARAPAGVPAVAAATLPLNGLTAVQALDRLGLGEGQSLLVTGAAGAVGGFAVQLAAGRGLRVAAVAGEDDEELVRAMGAEWFVPRSAARLGTAVREFAPAGWTEPSTPRSSARWHSTPYVAAGPSRRWSRAARPRRCAGPACFTPGSGPTAPASPTSSRWPRRGG